MSTQPRRTVRTGSNVPAYFLGRPRARYVAAYSAAKVTDANFAKAA